jgi:hypothetical protein
MKISLQLFKLMGWLIVLMGQERGWAQTPAAAVPPPTPYQAGERGPHHTVWQRTVFEQRPDGEIASRVQQYTELASGLNFLENGRYTPSQELIEPAPGGAVAQRGQYQVSFAENINTEGAITHQAEGKRLRSNPVALAYYDQATGREVVLAAIKDSQGELVSANQVLYPDAFDNIMADIRYTYSSAFFEQEVILRSQLPAPEAFGMNPASTELEVYTEFVGSEDARVAPAAPEAQSGSGLEPDELISWGVTTLGRGHAFDLEDATPVPVSKAYVTVEGRHFLVEKVLVKSIRAHLAKLPEQAGLNRRLPVVAARGAVAPQRPQARKTGRPLKYARVAPTRGFVLDYIALSGGYTNYTFQADSVYYISAPCNLYGTNIFEGGAVLKYATNGSVCLIPGGGVSTPGLIWKGSAYDPVVFTAVTDNTVGQSISSGTPSGYYGNPMLELAVPSPLPCTGWRMSFAKTGLELVGVSAKLYDAQFIGCQNGVTLSGAGGWLGNALFANTVTNFILGGSSAVTAENTTFSGSALLASGPAVNQGAVLALTNCILANVTSLLAGVFQSAVGNDNGFYATPYSASLSPTYFSTTIYPFQSVLGGGYYLANGCIFHGVGTATLDPTLWELLASKTTHGPVVYSNTVFSVATSFGPQVARDTNAAPDLGWHYDALDYIFGGANATTNLTFTAGTAVGWFNGGPWSGSSQGYGIALNGSAQATFTGTATSPCIMARNNMVQEGTMGAWTDQAYLGGFIGLGGNNTQATAPTLNLDFTHFYSRNNDGAFFRDYGDGTLIVINANNSEFYAGSAGGYMMYFNFTNCLAMRAGLGVNCFCAGRVTMCDCTYYGGLLGGERSGATWPVVVQNCAFDGTSFTYMDDPSNGNTNITYCNFNSFDLGAMRTPREGTNDLTITNGYNWETSWFGNYYLPTNSPLITKGSCPANLVGLYHFTTQTNQLVEGTNIVDIGYHYVATDAYGNPLDTNGDGIPDYLEDANGDGLADDGEIPWNIGGPPTLNVLISEPRNGTTVP